MGFVREPSGQWRQGLEVGMIPTLLFQLSGGSNMTIATPPEAISRIESFTIRNAGPTGESTDLRAAIKELLLVFHSLVVQDSLLNLVAIRIAQLNRCALSLAAYVELAKLQGEHPMRLCHLSAWRDSNLFGPRERAALACAEAVATSAEPARPRLIDEFVDAKLSEKDISDLGLVVALVDLCSQLSRVNLRPVERTGVVC